MVVARAGVLAQQASDAAPENVGARLSRWWQAIEPLLISRSHQLILFDGEPEHLIVMPTGEVALIDVENLRAGDGLMDLAVITLHQSEVLQGVLEAYPALSADAEVVLAFYQFLRALAATEWGELSLTGECHRHCVAAPAHLRERHRRQRQHSLTVFPLRLDASSHIDQRSR